MSIDYVLVGGSIEPTLERIQHEPSRPYSRFRLEQDRLTDDEVSALRRTDENELRALLRLDGKLANILDLVNYCRNGRRYVSFDDPGDLNRHLTLANNLYLNGPYLVSHLAGCGFEGDLILNYAIHKRELEQALAKRPPVAIISTSHIQRQDLVMEIAQFIRSRDSEICIVVGGGGIYSKFLNEGMYPDAFRQYLLALMDLVNVVVVEAQGESTLIQVISSVLAKSDTPLEDIANLVIKAPDGSIVRTVRQKETNSLDENFVRWNTVPRGALRSRVPVQSSRGCLMACNFCDFWRVAGPLTLKSIAALRQELRALAEIREVRYLQFTDDDFGVVPGARAHEDRVSERITQICSMMVEERFSFRWAAFVRGSFVTEAVADWMARAGCELVYMGLESGDDSMLRAMNKQLTTLQALRAVELLRQRGIMTMGSFIVGYPGETKETIARTAEYIDQLNLFSYRIFLFIVERSRIQKKVWEESGLQGTGTYWRHKTMDSETASSYIPWIVRQVRNGFYDGFHPWESYFVMRANGFSVTDISAVGAVRDQLVRGAIDAGVPELRGPERDALLASADQVISRAFPVQREAVAS